MIALRVREYQLRNEGEGERSAGAEEGRAGGGEMLRALSAGSAATVDARLSLPQDRRPPSWRQRAHSSSAPSYSVASRMKVQLIP